MDASERLSLVPTPTGLDSLRVQRDHGGFATLHSLHDPWEEACRFSESLPIKDGTSFLVVLGTALGYHILALSHRVRSMPKPPTVWAVEMDEAIASVCKERTDLGLFLGLPGSRLLGPKDLDALKTLEGLPDTAEVLVARHPASYALHRQEYMAWEAILEDQAARRRVACRLPALRARLDAVPGAEGVARVREAARSVLRDGPPYGDGELALLLLDRVHHYE